MITCCLWPWKFSDMVFTPSCWSREGKKSIKRSVWKALSNDIRIEYLPAISWFMFSACKMPARQHKTFSNKIWSNREKNMWMEHFFGDVTLSDSQFFSVAKNIHFRSFYSLTSSSFIASFLYLYWSLVVAESASLGHMFLHRFYNWLVSSIFSLRLC